MRRHQVLRLKLGLSLRRLAARVDIHRQDLSGMESGRINATPEELTRLGKALGCPPGALLDHIDESAFLPPGAEARDAQGN